MSTRSCSIPHCKQLRCGKTPGPIRAHGPNRRTPVAEEIEALGGVEYLGVKGVMDALGMTAGSIVAALRREGRRDLAAPFVREEDREKAARKPTAITGVYLTPRDLADRLGIPRQTVYTRDSRGTGPKVTKDGYFTYYLLGDVVEWEQRNKAGRAA